MSDRQPNGHFAKGNKASVGRPQGTTNKIVADLKKGLLAAAENIGNLMAQADLVYLDDVRTNKTKANDRNHPFGVTGSAGLVRYLEFLALFHPAVFGGLMARTMPKEQQVETNGEDQIPLEEVKRRLRDRFLALPPEERLERFERLIDITPERQN